MSKDPAVLFYTSDFLTGTLTMSDDEVGKYIKLLCLQHQKGRLTEQDMLFICSTYVENIYNKFQKDKDGKYYNKRMEEESIKRNKYSESRRKNISKRYEPTYVEHMENVNVNVNNNVNKDNNIPDFAEFLFFCKGLKIYNDSMDFQLEAKYDAWIESGWKDGNNKKIKNWKTKIRNTLPYFKNTAKKEPEWLKD